MCGGERRYTTCVCGVGVGGGGVGGTPHVSINEVYSFHG